jgi:hypothetical protein
MTTDEELDLVETERLMDALYRRFDCVLIGTLAGRNDQAEERGVYWRGGFVTAMGLAEFTRQRLLAKLQADAQIIAEEDDIQGDDEEGEIL